MAKDTWNLAPDFVPSFIFILAAIIAYIFHKQTTTSGALQVPSSASNLCPVCVLSV